jgi:secreted trypsin-like serine protease
MRFWVAGGVLLAAGCSASDDVHTRSEPIIQGTRETDAPWAVMVVQQPAGSTRVRLCTGTVIAPRAVLTAKHCVFRDTGTGTWATVPTEELTVRTGLDFRSSTRTLVVTNVRTTEGPYRDGDGRNGADIAVLLTRDGLDGTPVALSSTPAVEGSMVRIVGYGYTRAGATDPADLGIVHSGEATVGRVEANVFSTTGTQWTCTGDSGGPALDRGGRLVGVTSIGPSGCRVSTSYYTRVDRYASLYADLVTPVATDAGPVHDVLDPPTDTASDDVASADIVAVRDSGTTMMGGTEGGCTVAARAPRSTVVWCTMLVLCALSRSRSCRAARGGRGTCPRRAPLR